MEERQRHRVPRIPNIVAPRITSYYFVLLRFTRSRK